MINVANLRAALASRLAAAGIDDAPREAAYIISAALGLSCADLLQLDVVSPAAAAKIEAIAARRAAREPFAYIIGSQEFWGLEFKVTPETLIPRADSETLISAVLANLPNKNAALRVLDLGTGTGCLLLALLHEYQQATGIGVDISAASLKVAAENAAQLGLAARAKFLQSNWWQQVPAQQFDLIISNPPYISAAELPGLQPEVKDYEPQTALVAAADGMAAYQDIISRAAEFLAPTGWLVLEAGHSQAPKLAKLLAATAMFNAPNFYTDLAGVTRAVAAQKAPT